MCVVYWTHEASERLGDIKAYLEIEKASPVAAREMIEKIVSRTQQLTIAPLSGKSMPDYPDDNVRELLERPYRIFYQVIEENIYIISVMHYRQLIPKRSDYK